MTSPCSLRRAIGALLLLLGTLLVVGGFVTAVFMDPYDIGRDNLIVIGIEEAGFGLCLGALGWFLARRR
jgi:hypothetical protein